MPTNIKHPCILVEISPVADVSNNETDTLGVADAISAPSAKVQLMQLSQSQMFQPGWMQFDDVKSRRGGKGAKQKNGCEIDNISRDSVRGMFLRTRNESGLSCGGPSSDNCSRGITSGTIYIQNDSSDIRPLSQSNSNNTIPITYLKSDNPLCETGVPCVIRGYIFEHSDESDAAHEHDVRCSVVGATCVRVLSPVNIQHLLIRKNLRTSLLSGETDRLEETIILSQPSRKLPPLYSKLACYDKETVTALALRMSIMLINTTWIGTTPTALRFWKRHMAKTTQIDQFHNFHDLQRTYCLDQEDSNKSMIDQQNDTLQSTIESESDSVPYLLKEGALLLYNSYPNSGKTTLVTTIAKEVLKCDAVHVLSAPAIFAKYGTGADAALETMLHELVLHGALQSTSEKGRCTARVCIVLDHFETFVDHGSSIDSYTPVLNSMASYLNRLSNELKSKNEFPFPSSNPLYNRCNTGNSQTPGFAIPVQLCLIGVMTCQDDDSNKQQNSSQLSRAFDAIGGDRMRLTLPSASTRLAAFQHTFGALSIGLDNEASQFLPELSASATWAFGQSFIDVSQRLRALLDGNDSDLATKQNVLSAFDFVGSNQVRSSTGNTSSLSVMSTTSGSTSCDLFKSVGGNIEAKLAIEDALALNPKKRRLLSLFGLQAPTGVLLYGPPGTGKTLLARAIAQAISTKDKSHKQDVGGAFISLKASGIVRPEIGNSEKLIVTAFESARVNAPSVVFIDEFQALFGDRESSGVIVGQLATTLLQCMADISRWSDAAPSNDNETPQNARIVVLGATNTPWMIDKAFLRPGRFDRAVHVGLPSLEERVEILRVHSCKMKLAPSEDVDDLCKSMGKLCLGYSGADLAALCRAAAVRCLSEGDDADGIQEKHYTAAFMHDVVPSSNDELVHRIAMWKA